ncbi:MAG TPA: hypothetical protein VM734_33115 [Kofleriaceae bacterium]|jgi:hypothetical protein|nr:hypothetical protein [Kofleriaceae bacterium]
MLIDLPETDVNLLRQIVRNERWSLLNELAHTDDREYRRYLRCVHDRLEAIARSLDHPVQLGPNGRDRPRATW